MLCKEYGPFSFTTSTSFSSVVTLNETYDRLYMTRSLLTSACTIYAQVSSDGTVWARAVRDGDTSQSFKSAPSLCYEYDTSTSGYWAPAPVGFNYIKFEVISLPASAVSFRLMASKV